MTTEQSSEPLRATGRLGVDPVLPASGDTGMVGTVGEVAETERPVSER